MADFSKLSDDELLALKAGDFSKLSNEALLSLKGDAPDTSFLEKLQAAGASAKEQAKDLSPINALGLGARDKFRETFEQGAETIADLPQAPIKMAGAVQNPLLSTVLGGLNPAVPQPAQQGEEGSFTVPPEVAGPVAGATSITPDLIETIIGAKTGGASKLAKAAGKTRFSSRLLGKEIGKAEEAAGIEQLAPTVERISVSLGLPKNTKFSDIINAVNKVAKEGGKLAGQVAADVKSLIDDLAKTGKISLKGTKSGGLATQARRFATEQLNQAVPGRGDAAARLRQLKILQKSLGLGAIGGATDFARRKLINLFK